MDEKTGLGHEPPGCSCDTCYQYPNETCQVEEHFRKTILETVEEVRGLAKFSGNKKMTKRLWSLFKKLRTSAGTRVKVKS